MEKGGPDGGLLPGISMITRGPEAAILKDLMGRALRELKRVKGA